MYQKHAALAEVFLGQAFDGTERVSQFTATTHEPHTDAATAGRTLEHDGVADAFSLLGGGLDARDEIAARQQGHMIAGRQITRQMLEAEIAHLRRRRTDEDDAGGGTCLGKRAVLAQESVAWMDRFGAGCLRGA